MADKMTMQEDLISLKHFFLLVEEMRNLQKDYFASRAPGLLHRAKAREKEVDDFIRAYKQRDMPRQGSLLHG